MPDEIQPVKIEQQVKPVPTVDVSKPADGLLGTKANTALQYGIFTSAITALTVFGPIVYTKLQAFHTEAVQSSAAEHKAAREAFAKDLQTILQDAKADRKEVREAQEKSSDKVWNRVGKLSDSLDANTKANAGLIVEQHNLVVELRDERRRGQPAPAKAAPQ